MFTFISQLSNGMKNILVFTATLLLLFACNPKSNDNQEVKKSSDFNFTPSDSLESESAHPLILGYEQFLHTLDSTDIASVNKASDKYKELFVNQSKGLGDTAFVVFYQYINTFANLLSEELYNDTTDYSPFIHGDSIVPVHITNFQKRLQQNGFLLSAIDGMVYIQINRDLLARNFYPFLSEPMTAYLKELHKEFREGFATNGMLTITPAQLVERTLWYETFIRENPNFIFIGDCKNYRKYYLTYLMNGFENTRLFNQNNELTAYFRAAYDIILKKHPNTETFEMIKPYYEAINSSDIDKAKSILKGFSIKGWVFMLY